MENKKNVRKKKRKKETLSLNNGCERTLDSAITDRKKDRWKKPKTKDTKQTKNQKVYLLNNGCERARWNERAIYIRLRNQGLCSKYKSWMHESRFLKKTCMFRAGNSCIVESKINTWFLFYLFADFLFFIWYPAW